MLRGTENTGAGASITSIGRAKSRGFQYVTGASSNQFANTNLTTAIYKHYLFDINMFTHLNITSNTSFTTGEKITGGTSGATATLESLSTTTSNAVSSISVASPIVVTSNAHNLKEGQQINLFHLVLQLTTAVQ